ncbi:hypothetical protein C8R46DRAFT_1037061 [Mycena filopes]|nr:hypothetical protein C8R46DRAFT_1037061 [Mycena filopes]
MASNPTPPASATQAMLTTTAAPTTSTTDSGNDSDSSDSVPDLVPASDSDMDVPALALSTVSPTPSSPWSSEYVLHNHSFASMASVLIYFIKTSSNTNQARGRCGSIALRGHTQGHPAALAHLAHCAIREALADRLNNPVSTNPLISRRDTWQTTFTVAVAHNFYFSLLPNSTLPLMQQHLQIESTFTAL